MTPAKILPLLFAAAFATASCSKPKPITDTFSDDFERQQLGEDYHNTGGPYRIEEGKLRVKGAFNKPLWLRRPLPRNAEISFTVKSDSRAGDIKVEAWGDGKTFATHKGAYLASSYVFIFGGWGNAIAALCRLDEHGKDRLERRDLKVKAGQTYHFKIRRQGKRVEWFIDGKLFLALDDSAPLEGEHHRYFGFNNWDSDLTFDNLRIKALK